MIATLNCANEAPEKAVIRTASANTRSDNERSDNDLSDSERIVEWMCISVSFAQSSFACPVLINGCGLRGLKGLTRRVNSEMLVTAGATAHPLETLVSKSWGCRAVDIQDKGLTGRRIALASGQVGLLSRFVIAMDAVKAFARGGSETPPI